MQDTAKETENIKKARYALMYAKDITIPVGANQQNTEMVHFRWLGGFIWFLARNKAARTAIQADRFRFIKIVDKKAA